MRLNTGKLRLLPRVSAALLGGLSLLAVSLPANSGGYSYQETGGRYYNDTGVYADFFGNLVIQSPAGYKRIVVGQGDLADELETDEPPANSGGYGYQETGVRYYNDTRVYADFFGNLVIQSPAGYKRIVVGQGDLADELETDEPKVLYHGNSYDGRRYSYDRRRYLPNCRPVTHVLKGRGFMYGVPRGGNVRFNNWDC